MATVPFYGQWVLGGVHEDIATPITSGDVTGWLDVSHIPDKTLTVKGTWDGATIVVQGANADDQSDAFTLTDPQANALSRTDDFGEVLQENPKYLRLACTVGGDDTSLTARCISRRGL